MTDFACELVIAAAALVVAALVGTLIGMTA